MNCFKCATPIPDNSRFCLSCGADISGDPKADTAPVEAGAAELERMVREAVGGEYEIERELGRGGMAIVYLARDVQLDRKLAIKVLPPDLGLGKGLNQRFLREARTAAALDHPHIIPIYKVGSSQRILWYAMKFIEGRSLNDILQETGPLSIEAVRSVVGQTAGALAYAHRQGVIHRDMKPANIMLNDEGWVIVTDFGIAKAVGDSSLTGSGSVLGTPYYMSPEQCEGKHITPAADQYSLGILTYQLLTGHLPFEGDSVVEIIKKHCLDVPPPVEVLRPEAPPEMRSAVKRALEKNPANRFSSVAEFAAALGAEVAKTTAVAGLRLMGGEASGPPATSGERAKTEPVLEEETPASPARRRRVPWRIGIAAAGALVATAAVFSYLKIRSESQSAAASHMTPPASPELRSPTALPLVPQAGESAAAQESLRTDSASSLSTASVATGELALTNLPAGSSVSVDGRAVRGPRVTVTEGRHRIRVIARGYDPWQTTARVRAGAATTLVVAAQATALAPSEVAPSVTGGRPERAVPAPVTPQAAQAPVTQRPSPQQANAQPAAIQPERPAAPAVPSGNTGYLIVTASGAFGAVYVDGRLVRAQTPLLNHPLVPGVHTVRIERAGFETQQQQVTLAAGDTVRVRFVMRPASPGGQRDTTP